MFTIKCYKSQAQILHVYSTKSFTVESNRCVIKPHDHEFEISVGSSPSYYQKVFIENPNGKTIAHFRVTDMEKNHVEGF